MSKNRFSFQLVLDFFVTGVKWVCTRIFVVVVDFVVVEVVVVVNLVVNFVVLKVVVVVVVVVEVLLVLSR